MNNDVEAFSLTSRPLKGGLANALQKTIKTKLIPSSNEVLVKIYFTTVTIDDINISEGTELGGIPLSPSPSSNKPVTPGVEMSGIVAGVGKNVVDFTIGDAVFGTVGFPFTRHGAWSEYCCVNPDFLFHKPNYLSYPQAAAFSGSGMVCSAVFQHCQLNKSHRVLIIGASGGVGTIAVQMAKTMGAYVIAVCSNKNKALVQTLGADEVIDYHTTSFVDVLHQQQSGLVDFVFDFVGGKDIERDGMSVLKENGHFKTIVGPVRYLGDSRLGWFGITRMISYILWRWFNSFFHTKKYKFVAAGSKAVFPYFEEVLKRQTIVPVIDKIVDFSISDVRQAINYVRSHRASGKVVVKVAYDTNKKRSAEN